ncbi:MAG: multifunctional transcriptional regulator/nicotinamide-nucleotide adenylyltransferase/ribosylnicotinamide kinase NadR [Roseivirga sp.]
MVNAFVFGKFLPFHLGHKALIDFALEKCDNLTVLVCCSDREKIPCELRKSWIATTFEGHERLTVKAFNYLESDLPNTSESSKEVSSVWAAIFKNLVPKCSLLVTSEKYGTYVAEFMNIQHITFDIGRQYVPISATAVRQNPIANWKFLPDSVKPHFALKVVILGTESTGKSMLTDKLSQYFKCNKVTETGRELIPNSNKFDFEDLNRVAKAHAYRISKSVLSHSPLTIIDTDIHITSSYARFIFNRELKVAPDIYAANKASLYLYLSGSIDYTQDGTRLSETERNKLDASHRQVLKDHHIHFIEIDGDWQERFDKSLLQIKMLIAGKN